MLECVENVVSCNRVLYAETDNLGVLKHSHGVEIVVAHERRVVVIRPCHTTTRFDGFFPIETANQGQFVW
jgi:hypothetical protein